MKTLIKHSLIVAVLLTTLTSYATGVEPLVRVVGKDHKAFMLKMNDLKSQQVKIIIKDDNEIVLHSEKINSDTESLKKYDLEALPNGAYTLEIEDNSSLKVMPFEVSTEGLIFLAGDESEIYKPYLRQRGNMVDVMFHTTGNSATSVTIYDNEGHLLESNRVAAGENVEKIFDFSKVVDGTYTFTFKSAGHTFTKEIAIVK